MKKTDDISFIVRYAELIKITVAIIISVVGATWAAFALFDKQGDQRDDLDRTLIEMNRTVQQIKHAQDSLILRIDDFDGQLGAVNDNTVLIGNYVEGVKKALDYHLKRSPEVSKEDYAAMMEIIDELKKKQQLTPPH